MLMWCSARFKRGALTAAAFWAASAVGACDGIPFLQQAAQGAVEAVRPTDAVQGEAARRQTAPGEMRTLWTVADDATAEVVGRLRINRGDMIPGVGRPISLAFANGITTRLEPVTIYAPDDPSGAGGASFAGLLGADPRTDVFVYRVEDELVGSSARGGLCGGLPTTHVAIVEFSEADGARVLRIVSFLGDVAPGSLSGDPGFCRVLRFQAQ
jgi:hypothetical protein